MNENKLSLTLLMILAMSLWGGGWIANKLIVYEANILVLTFWRFFITLLTITPLFFFYKDKILLNIQVIKLTTTGALLNIAFMLVAFLGVMNGFAGSAGVIITTISPMVTYILASFLFGYIITQKHKLGLFLGFLGGLFMFEIWKFDILRLINDGSLYFIFAAIIWSLVTINSQQASKHINIIHYTIILTFIATIILFFVALPFGLLVIFEKDFTFWLALIYISSFGQGIATTIYYFASSKLGSANTSSYMFIIPVSALFFSYLILDEVPNLFLIIGGIVNMLALYIITKKPQKSIG
ncbi:DMT family transporter [Arcobacter sp. FWKO B]|uniref:DMT family transporter n=1 Tax=Arcobacter sp. FWKO B TaxID=2593672 RepID=UPI0018A68065|nr:DMT family transporter [Arcobacter sp. FWKO B]QOG11720.1 DMT family transporter [Arcobacter sp. FWKO B]